MSVAFRREGDEEHLEPKFEIPIPPGPNRVTARGFELIRARVAELTAAIVATGESGQPPAEAALTALRRDLRYWQTREITAELMPLPDGSVAGFGTTVRFTLNGKDRVLTLVGDDEADPAAGLIAFSAPLARALSGGEPGDVLPFGGRNDAIEIVAIDAAGGRGMIAILVDADACPVKDEIYRVAQRYKVPVTIVSNSPIRVPADPLFSRVVVSDGFDAADDWIAERAAPGTICVTADILLADRCLKAGAVVLGPTGKPFTTGSIGAAVATRAIMADLRANGDAVGGPPPFGKTDRSRFLSALDEALVRLRRAGHG